MSDLKKLDSFPFETSENHLIRNFLRNGRVRINSLYHFVFNDFSSRDIYHYNDPKSANPMQAFGKLQRRYISRQQKILNYAGFDRHMTLYHLRKIRNLKKRDIKA